MFTAALFTIASTGKKVKCLPADEWIKNKWYIYNIYIYIYMYMYMYICVYTHTHTEEYYSALKRSETGSFLVIRMDLRSVIQSEGNQEEKNKYHVLCIYIMHFAESRKILQINLFAGQE